MKRRRINLATRPLENQLFPGVVLAVLLLAAVVFTTANLTSYIAHARAAREFSQRVDEAKEEIAELRSQRQQNLQALRTAQVSVLNKRVDAANLLLRQRRFSWTRLFNELEKVQPYTVQLERVQPSIQKGTIVINVAGEAKKHSDLLEYEDRLEASPSFHRVYPRSEGTTDQGTYRFVLAMEYEPITPLEEPPAPGEEG